MYYYDLVGYSPTMSPQVPFKSKGQHFF